MRARARWGGEQFRPRCASMAASQITSCAPKHSQGAACSCGGVPVCCSSLPGHAVWNAASGVLNLSAFRPLVNAHERTYEAGSCYHSNYVNIGVARGRVTKGQTKDKRQRRKEAEWRRLGICGRESRRKWESEKVQCAAEWSGVKWSEGERNEVVYWSGRTQSVIVVFAELSRC